MAELLGDTTQPGSGFEPDSPGPAGYQAPSTVATETARSYMEAAETLAATAISSKKLVIPCSAPADAAAEQACVTSFVKDFGARAYRRALVQGEVDDLVALFQKAKSLGFNFQDAVTHTVEAMLQSPNLLYHWEIGDKPPVHDPENPALVALTPDQLAARLSYFLWESPPDAALEMAAQSGQLATPEGLKAQAVRLLADDNRARRALFNFHRQWLHVDNLEDLDPGTDLGLQLGQELEAFVASVFVAGDGREGAEARDRRTRHAGRVKLAVAIELHVEAWVDGSAGAAADAEAGAHQMFRCDGRLSEGHDQGTARRSGAACRWSRRFPARGSAAAVPPRDRLVREGGCSRRSRRRKHVQLPGHARDREVWTCQPRPGRGPSPGSGHRVR